jgi:predicted phosphodiesterase
MPIEAWGLISDVHGNLPALERALRVLDAAGTTRLAFLGDYLGRGESDRCVELIQRSADIAVVGNRDLDWQERVSSASKAWVLSLPRTAEADGLLVSHGDARLTPRLSTGQIRRNFEAASKEMERCEAQVWAFGHSHQARVWRLTSNEAELLTRDVVAMDQDTRYVVNVGTTGLPFPGKGGPSVALIDFKTGHIRQIALAQH